MSDKPPRYASWTAGKLPLPELLAMKRRGEKIVMVTAYDAPSARLADAAGVDLILVGDSSGMVVHGRESTVPVTLEEILFMTQWVSRGAKRPLVVADMPFGSYETSNEQAVTNAVRLVKEGGADAVKLERGGTSVERARAIVDAGIPVMGHVGLTPQTATVLGGFKAQGRTADRAQQLLDDSLALQGAGCFAIVLEAVPSTVAEAATRALGVPTIGIGAGRATDGQVLVWHDMLGFYEGHAPRFVKRYAELGDAIVEALGRYAEEVRSGVFPQEQHTYAMPAEEREAFEAKALRKGRKRGRNGGGGLRLKRRRRGDERRERRGERDRRCGSAPRPAVHRAHSDQQQQDGPREKAEVDAAEDRVAAPVVVATRAKEILAVHGDPDGPEGQQRERERRGGERERLPGAAPAALAAEPARGAVQQAADEPVRDDRVERAGDEREHRHERQGDRAVVQHAAERRARQDGGDARERGDRDERLLPLLGGIVRVVAERREDRTRRDEHRGRAQPPVALERRGRCRGGFRLHAGQGSLTPWTPTRSSRRRWPQPRRTPASSGWRSSPRRPTRCARASRGAPTSARRAGRCTAVRS